MNGCCPNKKATPIKMGRMVVINMGDYLSLIYKMTKVPAIEKYKPKKPRITADIIF